MDDVATVVEGAALDVAKAVITPEHVAQVEALVDGLIVTAATDAIKNSVSGMPFLADVLAKLVTTERVQALLKAAEAKVVALARAAAGSTATTFDDQLVEIVAQAEGV